MKKVKRLFKKAFINMIRARQRRAAEDLANHLIQDNSDFRTFSHADLTRAIMSKREVKLDQISR